MITFKNGGEAGPSHSTMMVEYVNNEVVGISFVIVSDRDKASRSVILQPNEAHYLAHQILNKLPLKDTLFTGEL